MKIHKTTHTSMKPNFLDCWKRKKDLPAFESGELPPERAEALAAHLAVCPRCRSEWETLSTVAQTLRAAPPAATLPSVNLWSRIEAELLEPVPAVPPPAPRWRVAALPIGAALACAVAFAATGKLGLLTRKPAPVSAVAAVVPVEPLAPVEAVVVMTKVKGTPIPAPTPDPLYDSEPAPTPNPVRPKLRRPAASPRRDPFAPAGKNRRLPRPERTPDALRFEEPEPGEIAIVATPPRNEPEVRPAPPSAIEPEPDAVIRVERPVPPRTARRDAAADAEAAERRAADALGSPLDAVARAAQTRNLFP
jgi:hypothetical protein